MISVRRGLQTLLVAALLGLFIRTFLFQAYRIPSSSMEPGLEVGDQVVVNKVIFGPTRWDWERRLLPTRSARRNDLVIFRYPGDPRAFFIKRAIALEGDRVEIVDKELLVEGEKKIEPWAEHRDPRVYPNADLLDDTFRLRDQMAEITVPQGEIWCLGDNRDNSLDSRYWGSVPLGNLVGRPVLIYSSFDRESGKSSISPRWHRWLSPVR